MPGTALASPSKNGLGDVPRQGQTLEDAARHLYTEVGFLVAMK